jgi:hypothetical protein
MWQFHWPTLREGLNSHRDPHVFFEAVAAQARLLLAVKQILAARRPPGDEARWDSSRTFTTRSYPCGLWALNQPGIVSESGCCPHIPAP